MVTHVSFVLVLPRLALTHTHTYGTQDLAQHTDIHGHSAHWGVGSQHLHLAEAGIL